MPQKQLVILSTALLVGCLTLSCDDEPAPFEIEGEIPGADCHCDSDCLSFGGFRAICVFGICMTRPNAPCDSGGAREICPFGYRCREVHEYGGEVCYPPCSDACEGRCDREGFCIDTEDSDFGCRTQCSAYCSDDNPPPLPAI